jgi:molecular chaperone GrpE
VANSDDNLNDDGAASFDEQAVDASVAQAIRDVDDVTSQVLSLKCELADANDRVLRTQAELENFRRRTRRDMEEGAKYAKQELLLDLLPVVDNIERALESSQQNSDLASLLQGVTMVSQQLLSVLNKHNCPRIGAPGDSFDPEIHEAIAQQPSDEFPPGAVVLVARPGYKLYDRIIRPAQVIVSSGKAAITQTND